MKRIAKCVQHNWKRTKRGVYSCNRCKGWTANLPLYKNEVCPKKDRRKRQFDRRKPI